MKRFTLALVLLVSLVAAGCSAEDRLVGLWVFAVEDANPPGIETRIDLQRDGTGTFTTFFFGEEMVEDITWSAEADRLCLTTASRAEPDCTAYSVDGDEMTLDIPGEGPLVFVRQAGD